MGASVWAAGMSCFAWRSSGSGCRAGEMAAPGGGSLAGAVGFNGAAADVPDEKLRLRLRMPGGRGGPR